MDIIRKDKGKCSAIIINEAVQREVHNFKIRLKEMAESPDDECRPIDKFSIQVILNELDEFDQNIIIAYYSLADCSFTTLGRTLGVEGGVIRSRINKIQTYVRNRATQLADEYLKSNNDSIHSGIHSRPIRNNKHN